MQMPTALAEDTVDLAAARGRWEGAEGRNANPLELRARFQRNLLLRPKKVGES